MAMMSITDSYGLMQLVRNSKGRNRSVDEKVMDKEIDPDGIHVMNFHFIHNDVEFRTEWMVKLRDDTELTEGVHEADGLKFVSVWLDVGFDAKARFTKDVSTDDFLGGTDTDPTKGDTVASG